MWDEQQSKQWYIGFVISESEDSLIVDHLERKGNDTNWQRPKIDDIQSVDMAQIVPCVVERDWDFTSRSPQFILNNSTSIIEKCRECWV